MQTSDVVERARAVLAGHPDVRWAYLFGSCARGESYRDVDIAVQPGAGTFPTLLDQGRLTAELEARLGARVDLVDLSHAPLPLAGTLLQDRLVLVDNDRDARHRWEAETTSRWIDFRFARQRFAAVRRKAIQQRLRGAS